jgi:hypothetical protein
MADQNPTGRGPAVALKLPADHVHFLRSTFEMAHCGVRDELRDFPERLDGNRLRREEVAYRRLLTALDELAIVPDADVRAVVNNMARVIDSGNEYERVVFEHEALHGLAAQLGGGEGR